MINKEIAKVFFEIADFLEMEDIPFRPQAYRRAALVLMNLEEDVGVIYKRGGKEALDKEVSGIGESLAKKIEEYIQTHKIKYLEQLRKRTPLDMEKLNAVEGLGPKRLKILYTKLGITTLEDLEEVAKSGKVAPLFGFGEKIEQNILESLSFFEKSKGRFLLGEMWSAVEEIKDKLSSLKEVERIDVAGSIRRGRETVGDVDFLVQAKDSKKIMEFFVSLPGVVKIWGKGETRSSIKTEQGFDVDLRIVDKKSYGSALQYFTGSKDHNIATRKIAIHKGLKLSEYGLFKGEEYIAGETEDGIYNLLGLPFIPPEIRENTGEIEAGFENKLPKLVEQREIKGDLHCHSNWSDGQNSILELAQRAISLGYEYLGITDHGKLMRAQNGLDEKRLLEQGKEIDVLNKEFEKKKINFRLLKSVEANILKDGSIDINNEVLAKLDYVAAGIHSSIKMDGEEMTDRFIKAMKNPYVKMIVHLTGRKIKKRNEYELDFDKIFKEVKISNTILEINAQPIRLDIRDVRIREAKEQGIKMSINTDAHSKKDLSLISIGILQARRGWAEQEDIINTLPLAKLLNFLKNNA
ncbi:MAG: DNA polymerase/3'-5' exonuclease PolX [Patescibacteria group bacterium]